MRMLDALGGAVAGLHELLQDEKDTADWKEKLLDSCAKVSSLLNAAGLSATIEPAFVLVDRVVVNGEQRLVLVTDDNDTPLPGYLKLANALETAGEMACEVSEIQLL